MHVFCHWLSAVSFTAALTGCAQSVQTGCKSSSGLHSAGGTATSTPGFASGHEPTTFNVTTQEGSKAPALSNGEAVTVSGFITFKLGKDPYAREQDSNALFKDRAAATCNATFHFKTVEGVQGAEVTTAAHCFRGMMALVEDIRVDVFDPGSSLYFPSLQAWSPFLERRSAFLENLSQAKFSAGVRELAAWDFTPGLLGFRRDNAYDIETSCKKSAPGTLSNTAAALYAQPGQQIFCFSGLDLVHFDLVFENRAQKLKAPPDFLAFAMTRARIAESRLEAVAATPIYVKVKALHDRRRKEAQAVMEGSLGNLFDALAVACSDVTFEQRKMSDPLSDTLGDPLGGALGELFTMKKSEFDEYRTKMTDACARKAEFEGIAEPHLRFFGMKPSKIKAVATLRDPITQISNRFMLEDYAMGESGDLTGDQWDVLSPDLKLFPHKLQVTFNLHDAKEVPQGPATISLQDLAAVPPFMTALWPNVYEKITRGGQSPDTLFVKIPKAYVRFNFTQGDSGTVITWEDTFPIMVLAAVDGAPTSGGASVVALPRRQAGAGYGEKGEARNEKKPAGKQTSGKADSGC